MNTSSDMLGQFHPSLTFEFTVKCLAAKRDGDKEMPFCCWVWTGPPVTRLETWPSRDLCSVHHFSVCSLSNEDAVLTLYLFEELGEGVLGGWEPSVVMGQ